MKTISVEENSWYLTGWSLAAATFIFLLLLVAIIVGARLSLSQARGEGVKTLLVLSCFMAILSLLVAFVSSLALKTADENWTNLEAALKNEGLSEGTLEPIMEEAKDMELNEYYRTKTFVLLRKSVEQYEILRLPQNSGR